MKNENIQVQRFTITHRGEVISCRIDSLPETMDDAALILLLNLGADETLDQEAYRQPALPFILAGHRAMSYDLPCHGSRVNVKYGMGIGGFTRMFKDGIDVFEQIVGECRMLLETVISMGLAREGRIAVCGCSRGGYAAFRALAADSRIRCAAAICPVTDWGYFPGFDFCRDEKRLSDTRLERYIPDIAGRPVHIVIGGHDSVVGTESCLRFYLNLGDENERRGYGRELASIIVTEDAGHTMSLAQRRRCGEFLMGVVNGT